MKLLSQPVLSALGSVTRTTTRQSFKKQWILISLIPIVMLVTSCGTVKSKDYTDLAIQNAVNEARIEAAIQASDARAREQQQVRDAIRLLLEQWASQEGRRPHRPGGA